MCERAHRDRVEQCPAVIHVVVAEDARQVGGPDCVGPRAQEVREADAASYLVSDDSCEASTKPRPLLVAIDAPASDLYRWQRGADSCETDVDDAKPIDHILRGLLIAKAGAEEGIDRAAIACFYDVNHMLGVGVHDDFADRSILVTVLLRADQPRE